MQLPVMPPVQPMLAKSVKGIPDPAKFEGGLSFEPKWDGFRCLVFRDGDEVDLRSRNTRELTRYFPEVVDAARESLPERCVVDGEIFVAIGERLEFERLLERIHPADSRVRLLAHQTPASLVVFDLLAIGDESLMQVPFAERRAQLETALENAKPPIHITQTTIDVGEATRWFSQFEGAGLDGVIAKPLASTYQPNTRTMFKVKHERTADVVIAGYRLHKTSTPEKPLLGSLLLGLYDGRGTLQHIGVAASFTAKRRAELIEELKPLETTPDDHPWGSWQSTGENGDRLPGAQSRWNAGKDLSFVALRPVLVIEVGYDHTEGTRFRHTAHFKRWRPDRDAMSCGYEQLEEPASYNLGKVLGNPEGGAHL
ncbi:MAG TPA: ATP-dependent DNA ligase [Nocardioidaceae bacterium]|nr:ATP-dependent DNA ligase [Nocardioidaceae bacterium]